MEVLIVQVIVFNDKQMNFIHELGHALKLAHPHQDKDYRPVSIMNIPIRPSGYDQYNLSRKW